MMSCIEILFEHNLTCRESLLDTLEQVNTEEFVRDRGVGKSSIRNILVHLVNTERGWISFLDNRESTDIEPESRDRVQSIREIWSRVHEGTREFMDKVREDQLLHVKSVKWGNQTVSFTIGKVLMHVATHETHHRGVLTGLIRQQGIDPPGFDMI
ncbi:DUF664 domain-containing protein [Candidatus Thorarchaeota archaeon]|nr:MAG: DUF664 domain-containing protein [Candidatus Thorarchaeota archaeon]